MHEHIRQRSRHPKERAAISKYRGPLRLACSLRLVDEVRYELGRIAQRARCQVGVALRGDAGGVAQQQLHLIQRCALVHEHAGEGVAAVMQSALVHLGGGESSPRSVYFWSMLGQDVSVMLKLNYFPMRNFFSPGDR